jgi:hypothetical protein
MHTHGKADLTFNRAWAAGAGEGPAAHCVFIRLG